MARFVSDEHVPLSVDALLRSHSHTVVRARQAFGPRTVDDNISFWANVEKAIVVTINRKDFFDRIYRRDRAGLCRFPHAGVVCFRVQEPDALGALYRVLDLVLYEVARADARDDAHVFIDVLRDGATVHRL